MSSARARLRKAKSAASLIEKPPLRQSNSSLDCRRQVASTRLVKVKSAKTQKRNNERDAALLKAYQAACVLLGPRSIELHLPKDLVRKAVVPEVLEEPSEEEKMRGQERALIQKIEQLEGDIDRVQKMTRRIEEQKSKHIRELDRVLFNTRCGMEIMLELAKSARMKACARALQQRNEKRKEQTPEFIKMLNEVSAMPVIGTAFTMPLVHQ